MSPESPRQEPVSSTKPPGKLRTWWHPLLAALLRWQLGSVYQVFEEVPVGTKPLQIDILLLRLTGGELPDSVKQMLAGIVDRLNDYTLLELKGPTDTLRAGDFRTLLAYAHLYCAQTAPFLNPAQLSLVVLAPRLTKPYRKEMRGCGVTPEAEAPGIWRLQGPVVHPMWVLETERLAGAQYPLLAAFSPAMLKERRRLLATLKAEGHETLMVYMAQQIKQFRRLGEDFAMAHMNTPEMEQMRQDILKEIRAESTIEEILEGRSPEEIVAALTPEQQEQFRACLRRRQRKSK